MDPEQRKFRTDPLKLKRLRVAAGLTANQLTKVAGLDRSTITKALRGEQVFLSTIKALGTEVFGIDNPMELLHRDELQAMGIRIDQPAPSDQILEWDVESHLTGWQETANGLQYQVAKLNHRYLPNRLARGKCYELRHLTGSEHQRVERYLKRHVEVCELIGDHKNIASNLTAAPIEGNWWVIDRWEDGESLANRIEDGPLTEFSLRVAMTGIANALNILHRAKVIRRELSPSSVLLRESNDHPVLTDLELAKLLEGESTVSPDEWPDDPYRALEVGDDAPVDPAADIYSWGRIFVNAATGELPERGKETLERPDVPKQVVELVMEAVRVARSKRPSSMKPILKALERWE